MTVVLKKFSQRLRQKDVREGWKEQAWAGREERSNRGLEKNHTWDLIAKVEESAHMKYSAKVLAADP